MIGMLRLVLGLAALAMADSGIGQSVSRPLPRITDGVRCDSSSGDDITVCGRRPANNDRYRIPAEVRDDGPVDARNESRVAAQREAESLDRFSAQMVGPGGYLQHSRQIDCEWRAARQTLQGRQPDCTVRIVPDAPGDWQRR
jgi:hypothetical protein